MTTDAAASGAVPDRAQVVIVGGGVTGFRAVGHLSLATTRERQDALRREAARPQIAPPYDPQRLRILGR